MAGLGPFDNALITQSLKELYAAQAWHLAHGCGTAPTPFGNRPSSDERTQRPVVSLSGYPTPEIRCPLVWGTRYNPKTGGRICYELLGRCYVFRVGKRPLRCIDHWKVRFGWAGRRENLNSNQVFPAQTGFVPRGLLLGGRRRLASQKHLGQIELKLAVR
jgi:hypothetical protein